MQDLYVGSIKTVVGHTEGTAGIAGLLKCSLAVQNGIIPPNMLLEKLSPRVEPFCEHLRVPKEALPWPSVPEGQPRRASVNSFGKLFFLSSCLDTMILTDDRLWGYKRPRHRRAIRSRHKIISYRQHFNCQHPAAGVLSTFETVT